MAVQSVTVLAHQAVSHVPEAEAATETSGPARFYKAIGFGWQGLLLDWHSLCNGLSSSGSSYLFRFTIREIRRPMTRKYVPPHVNIFSSSTELRSFPKRVHLC